MSRDGIYIYKYGCAVVLGGKLFRWTVIWTVVSIYNTKLYMCPADQLSMQNDHITSNIIYQCIVKDLKVNFTVGYKFHK